MLNQNAQQSLDLFMKIFNIEDLVEKQIEKRAAETRQEKVYAPQASFQA